jgi:hypothetical protein
MVSESLPQCKTYVNQDETQISVDTPLTRNVRFEQGVCLYYFELETHPIAHLSMAANSCHLGYTRGRAKDCGLYVDAHVLDRALTVS